MATNRTPRRLTLILVAGLAGCGVRPAQSVPDLGGPPPIDPQGVRDQDDMRWEDYRAIPGIDWSSPARTGSVRTMRVAIVPADYPDFPFVLTRKKESDLFGNPKIDPVKREDVPRFYADFYNLPQPVNHGHTIHEYWMESDLFGNPKIDPVKREDVP